MAITLTRQQSLFEDDAPIPKDDFKRSLIKDIKQSDLANVPDQNITISFTSEEGGDILTPRIDPYAAMGYSVFKDESQYNSWMDAQLYEPSEEEIQEAMQNGSGT